MVQPPIRVLHLEDNPHDACLIAERLRGDGCVCDVLHVNSRERFETALQGGAFDLVICDFNMPDYDGLRAIRCVRERDADTPVVVLSGTLGDEGAVACLKAGATDYVLKHNLARLAPVISRAIQEHRERRERRDSERRFSDLFEFAPDAILLTDSEGKIVQANRCVTRIFGWTAEELVGRPVEFLISPEERAAHARFRAAFLAASPERATGDGRMQLSGVRKGGGVFPIDMTLGPIRTPGGRLIVATVRDISERVRIEERRKAEHEVASALASNDGTSVLPRVLGAICGHLGWDVGAFWRLNRARNMSFRVAKPGPAWCGSRFASSSG